MNDENEYSALGHSMFRGFTLYTTHGRPSKKTLFNDPIPTFDFKFVDKQHASTSREGAVSLSPLECYHSKSANAAAFVLDVILYIVSRKEIVALCRKKIAEVEMAEGKKLPHERKVEIKQRIIEEAYSKAEREHIVETFKVPVVLANNMIAVFSRNKTILALCGAYLREQKLTNGIITIGLDDNDRYFTEYDTDPDKELHSITDDVFRRAVINGKLSITNSKFNTPRTLDVTGLAGTSAGSISRVVATHVEQHLLEQIASDTSISKIKVCPSYMVDADVQLMDYDISADLSVGGTGTLRIADFIGSDGTKGVFIHETDPETHILRKHEIDVVEAVVMLFNSVYFSGTTTQIL